MVDVSDGATLEQSVSALAAQVAALAEERDEYRKLVLHLREEIERLKRGLLGQKAERLPKDDAQLSLLMLGLALGGDASVAAPELPPVEQTVAEHTRAKPVRKPLPPNLPREEIEIVPPEVERDPDAFELIGTETREVLERRPSCTITVALIYKKYVRKDRKRGAATEVFAPTPSSCRSRAASPGRACSPTRSSVAGRTTCRSTAWRASTRARGSSSRDRRCAGGTRRLAELVRAARRGDARRRLQAAVPVRRCDRRPGARQGAVPRRATSGCSSRRRGTCSSSTRNGTTAPPSTNSSPATRATSSPTHTPSTTISTATAPSSRSAAGRTRAATSSRRSIGPRARQVRARLDRRPLRARALDGEHAAKEAAKIRQTRRGPSSTPSSRGATGSRPGPRRSPDRQGIRYARNQRVALSRFLDDGRLPIHNNMSELNLRREAVGRKNWLFVGSDDGGEVNATFVSLLASCSLHKIEPFAYMRDVLCLLPALAQSPRPRARARLLERDPQETRGSAGPRRQRPPSRRSRSPGGASHRPPELPRQAAAVSDG